MRGQWIGKYSGTNNGNIIVNIDEFPTFFEGVAYIHDDDRNLPWTFVPLRTTNKDNNFKIQKTPVYPIDPLTAVPSTWENIKKQYPSNINYPESADVDASWTRDSLTLSWVSSIGTTSKCTLSRSRADAPSEVAPEEMDWASFKNYVAKLEGKRHLFRGQSKPWRLRTAFHRTGRANLYRFLNQDLQLLHKHLSARTKHVFNLSIGDENGAFLNLIQHHGYPTPLLDWTYSPYVAVFFAYRSVTNKMAEDAGPNEKVRIHVFDHTQWRSDWNQLLTLISPHLHLSIGEFIAIENLRLVPQQAASTVTNIDDIESYIRSKETGGKTYLWAIDLPVRDRKRVFQELGYMGITAGSLFPGLDGACEELKERNFDI